MSLLNPTSYSPLAPSLTPATFAPSSSFGTATTTSPIEAMIAALLKGKTQSQSTGSPLGDLLRSMRPPGAETIRREHLPSNDPESLNPFSQAGSFQSPEVRQAQLEASLAHAHGAMTSQALAPNLAAVRSNQAQGLFGATPSVAGHQTESGTVNPATGQYSAGFYNQPNVPLQNTNNTPNFADLYPGANQAVMSPFGTAFSSLLARPAQMAKKKPQVDGNLYGQVAP